MGVTNIRSPNELLGHPGFTSRPCLMPELNCRMIRDDSKDSDMDLDRYTRILARGLSDKWVPDPVCENLTQTPRAVPCNNPRIHISNPIRLHWREAKKDAWENKSRAELDSCVAYFMVVEGVEGASYQKLVLRGTAEQIAEQAFYEAANGLSVVFSGLLLRRQLALLGREDLKLSFVRVQNVGGLLREERFVGDDGLKDKEVAATVFVCF